MADDQLFAQLQKKLLESGDWDRISSQMKARLNELGILDDLAQRSKETIQSMDDPAFRQILDVTKANTQDSLTPAVRKELLAIIRPHLDGLFLK